jgi:hypothetical protein
MENLIYRTTELEKYFSQNRIRWNQFYESERLVIEKTAPVATSTVLDIGCGCAGLGLALRERFGVTCYTGIEINADASASAKKLYPEAHILSGDFLSMDHDVVTEESYDLVFSLSCIDWNLTFDAMLAKAWSMVKPGGAFIASFRLTSGDGINDIEQSYQYINYDGDRTGEIAPYVVVNAAGLMAQLMALNAGRVFGYGYYGPPSKTAITPFKQLCFAVMAVQKAYGTGNMEIDLRLPVDIARSLIKGA